MACVAPTMIIAPQWMASNMYSPVPPELYPQAMGFTPMIFQPMPMEQMEACPQARGNTRDKKSKKSDKSVKPRAVQKQPSDVSCEDEAAGKGAISLLQEFVQCSKQFASPQHRPILQWTFDTHMADFTTLQFRAQVGFLLDGVAHHIAGCWQQSKKQAQRDPAERCLSFFVGSWGAYLLEQELETPKPLGSSFEEILENFCETFPACKSQAPVWSTSWDGDRCQAIVEMALLDVVHKFAGAWKSGEAEAKSDAAKRVLWYLQAPGFEDAFEPDPRSQSVIGNELPSPPQDWAGPAKDACSVHAAERKTALMRLQNRLQQLFARRLEPGQSLWEWSFEMDPNDAAWPPLCRANVQITAAGVAFSGPWTRGQREAQVETCKEVSAYLNSEQFGTEEEANSPSVSTCSGGSGSTRSSPADSRGKNCLKRR